jgi:8-oxo-dGTP diphosphatase
LVDMGLNDGDRFTRCAQGGRFGAAGLLVHHDDHVLLQRRAWWTPGGNTWGLFGGARHSAETPVAAALRETAEESTLAPDTVVVHGISEESHGNWSYHTVFGTVADRVDVSPGSSETGRAAWIRVSEVDDLRLFGPFGRAWPRLRAGLDRPRLVVDCANVMGTRPDGWWRDRAGAAARLRDQLDGLDGITGIGPFDTCYPEIVLVVEGRARGIGAGATDLRVVDAPGSGDDAIVALLGPGRTVVVTADRELRERCEAENAEVLGPRRLLDQVDQVSSR